MKDLIELFSTCHEITNKGIDNLDLEFKNLLSECNNHDAIQEIDKYNLELKNLVSECNNPDTVQEMLEASEVEIAYV